MTRQRQILVTVIYNDLGCIIDTKAEPYAEQNLQPTCNQLATDCISRQEAIVVFENSGLDDDSKDTVVRVLEQLPSAQPSFTEAEIQRMQELDSAQIQKAYEVGYEEGKAEPQWIPCSERLPERGTSILMASRQGWVAEGEYKGVLDGRHLWIEYRWSASLTNDEIIAWMPLPKPYGGESE